MSCFKCGFQAVTAEKHCRKCKRKLQTSRSIRIRGILLVLCGGFLVAFMGYILVWMLDAFRNTDALHARFTGTHEQMLLILGLCGTVILFGVISFATGLYQAILGRRNKIFVWSIAGLGAFLFLIGGYFLTTSK